MIHKYNNTTMLTMQCMYISSNNIYNNYIYLIYSNYIYNI
jgi:hypothetical protein